MDEDTKKKEIRQKYEDNDLLTLLSVHNLPVIVITLIGWGITLGVTKASNQYRDMQIQKLEATTAAIQIEQREQDLILERLSTKLGMSSVEGISTSSAMIAR